MNDMKYKLIAVILIAYILGYYSNCCQYRNTKSVNNRVTTQRITTKKQDVKQLEEATAKVKTEIRYIKANNATVTAQLDKVKVLRDTVKIVALQDTLINIQKLEIRKFESVVWMQGKTIDALKDIIEFQEMDIESLQSEIIDKNKDLKKFKRRKDLSVIGWIATTIGLIVILK